MAQATKEVKAPAGNGDTNAKEAVATRLHREQKGQTTEETRITTAPPRERTVAEQTGGRPVENKSLESVHHAKRMTFERLVKIAEAWDPTDTLQARLALNETESGNEKQGAQEAKRSIQLKKDDPPGTHKMNRELENHTLSSPKEENTLEVQKTKQNTEQMGVSGRKRKNEDRPKSQEQLEGTRN